MQEHATEGVYIESWTGVMCLGYIELLPSGWYLAHSHFTGGDSRHFSRDDAEARIHELYRKVRPTLSKYDR